MAAFPWDQFFVLLMAGVFGTLAGMPLGFALSRERLENTSLSVQHILLFSSIQNGILLLAAVSVGLPLSMVTGLGAPLLELALAGESVFSELAARIPVAVGLGVAAAVLVLLLDISFFKRRLPKRVYQNYAETALWKRFLAGFYGGINEEILTRLFLFSLLAWLLGFIWHMPNNLPTAGVFWAANIGAALAFGLGHLPATAAVTPLTRILIVRALLLNGIGGVAFGYVYWHYGLIAAMLAHYSADMVFHVIAPLFVDFGTSQPVADTLAQ
jgi:hypothetical protein